MATHFQPLHTRYEVRPNGCWRWTSNRDRYGYGQFKVGKRYFSAHRYFYEFFNSTRIPPGMVLDHICRTKACVNPQHLEIVTQRENSVRHYANQTECKHGHPLTGDNLYIRPDGRRYCRTCNR